jgi:signal transduction histidine kinase
MVVARPTRRDASIPAGMAVLVLAEVSFSSLANGPLLVDAPLYLASCLVLSWRRTLPEAAPLLCLLLVLAATSAGTPITSLTTSTLFLIVPASAIGLNVDGRRAWIVLASCCALVVVITGVGMGFGLDNLGFPLGLQVASYACSRMLRNRMLMTRALAEETARLELDREHRARAAVGNERARIAREMHDVVAHTMAIMVVQSGAARRVLDRDPAAAQRSLGTVEEIGRVALIELRRLLGFLNEEGQGTLEPQPTLDGIGTLAQRARDAGLPVELRITGEPHELPAGAELAGYRIVQEALTNSLKHAGRGARATVCVRWTDGGLELDIRDSGGVPGASHPGGGHGIVGMRERVALYGGHLEARPAEGGFVVRAMLPCERPAVAA